MTINPSPRTKKVILPLPPPGREHFTSHAVGSTYLALRAPSRNKRSSIERVSDVR